MQISVRLAAAASMVFAIICLWFAINGFLSLSSIADPEEASSARSFAWFWTFLAVVGAAIALASWKVGRAQTEDEDET